MRATAMKMSPRKDEVATDTITANLAAFGCPAPSSFDTRTL